jgi:hypothetical protein
MKIYHLVEVVLRSEGFHVYYINYVGICPTIISIQNGNSSDEHDNAINHAINDDDAINHAINDDDAINHAINHYTNRDANHPNI